MTDADKAALRALAEKATPGPWHPGVTMDGAYTEWRDPDTRNMTPDNFLRGGWAKCVTKIPQSSWRNGSQRRADAAYIASAHPAAVLALLARLEQVEGALEQITQSHIPDQPAAYGMDDLAWSQRHAGTLRAIARAALSEPSA